MKQNKRRIFYHLNIRDTIYIFQKSGDTQELKTSDHIIHNLSNFCSDYPLASASIQDPLL